MCIVIINIAVCSSSDSWALAASLYNEYFTTEFGFSLHAFPVFFLYTLNIFLVYALQVTRMKKNQKGYYTKRAHGAFVYDVRNTSVYQIG